MVGVAEELSMKRLKKFKTHEEFTEWEKSLTPEERKREKENLTNAFNRKHAPLSGNRCRARGCGGEVVQEVFGRSTHQGYSYHLPACNKCGRVYFGAVNAPKVGHEEFGKRMSVPFTR